MSEPTVAELRKRLDGLTIRDAARLGRRLKNLRGAKPDKLARLAEQIAAGRGAGRHPTAALPTITYPDLPVSERRRRDRRRDPRTRWSSWPARRARARRPSCPRSAWRSAAVSAAPSATPSRDGWLPARSRSASPTNCGTPLGEAVGYTVRFTDQVSDRTLVKLMTDGILLAEIQRDRLLLRYDTLILDEAHERSLNIDFLLGYLRELLPRRPDLKVIVTSATIEPQRFAAHFGGAEHGPSVGAPIVEVSGRTYPVEIRYRPLEVPVASSDDDDPDDPDHEVVAHRDARPDRGHHRRDRRTRERTTRRRAGLPVRRARDPRHRRSVASHARTPRCCRSTHGCRPPSSSGSSRRIPGRRVVLATNVAETSLTVPGIRYVVDPGTARISRYSRRTKVQRLPIEPISQASAAQRAGRSGRVAPRGVHPAVLRGRLRRHDRATPTRRSCARTWPR